MTANDVLDSYMSSLPSSERIAKSRDIRALCHVSTSVLSDWRRKRTPIPWYFIDKITAAIGENIFENVAN